MRRKAFTWWEAVLILVLIGILAAILFPIVGRSREPRHTRGTCQSNLKQMSLGIFQYMQDFEEKYPRVNLNEQGWMDTIQPYLKSMQLFQCPNDRSGRVNGTTDYFYNARLNDKPQASLDFSSRTIMNGDSLGDAPSNFSLTKFPATWATDSDSPAWRHGEGADYSFADGHVKWFKAKDITNKTPNESLSTFAPW